MPTWVENIDEDLKIERHKSINSKNQTDTIDERKENEHEEKEKDKLGKAVQLFAERVTIAGVYDLYRAKYRSEKAMWILALIFVCFAIIFTSRNLVLQHLHQSKVYNYYPMANRVPPFPSVSVCGPQSIDKKKFRQLLIIPNKTRELVEKNKRDLNAIIDFTLDFWSYDRLPVDITDSILAKATNQIMAATVKEIPWGITGFYLSVYPKCEQSLSGCSFYGKKFDCCSVAKLSFTEDSICYYFDVLFLILLLSFWLV
jgi:hypothetical protein